MSKYPDNGNSAPNPAIHTYQTGESLVEIAISHGVSLDDLCSLNGLTPASILFPGQIIRIPNRITEPEKPQLPANHVVTTGETIKTIAELYDLSVSELQKINNLSETAVIFPGTVLSLTATKIAISSTSTKSPKHCLVHGYHKVKPGDQLARIAAFHGVSTQALLSANDLSWNSIVSPGSKLIIPISHGPLDCPKLVQLSETAFGIASQLVKKAEEMLISDFGIVIALCLEMQRSGLMPELGNKALSEQLITKVASLESIENKSVREVLSELGYDQLAEGASLWEPSAWLWLHQVRSKGE